MKYSNHVKILRKHQILSGTRYKMIKKILNWYQGQIDKSYEKNGLSPRILESQIRLNKIRKALNITDDRTIIEDNEGFVQ